ncbi:MAG: MFS transporter [Chloroflexi bacterium]|nr:MFS transporter [Chloroflexota bacterium]
MLLGGHALDIGQLEAEGVLAPESRAETFGIRDYISINLYDFGLTGFWNALHLIILPVLMLDLVPEDRKNTYLGLLTVAGLLLAIVLQPLVGAMSDRRGLSWGRRRPYILVGTLLAFILLPGLGWAPSFTWLLLAYCSLQIATNIAQAPYQAYIRDLAPMTRLGKASGVKNLVGILGSLAMVGIVALMMGARGGGQEETWLWLSLALIGVGLLLAMALTLAWVHETSAPPPSPRTSLELNPEGALPGFRLFLASRFLVIAAVASVQTYAFYFVRDVVAPSNPSQAMALLALATGGAMLAAVYPAGTLSDRVGRRPLLIAAGSLGILGCIALLLTRGLVAMALTGLLMGVAAGLFLSANWALANDLVPRRAAARYLGLTNLATAGGALAARLGGVGVDWLNRQENGLGYYAVVAVAAVFIGAGTLLATKVQAQGSWEPAPEAEASR